MDDAKRMRFMVFDGTEVTDTANPDEVPPNLLAEVDQSAKAVDDMVTRLASLHTSVLLAVHDGDDDAAKEAVRGVMDACLGMERGLAMSVLNSFAATMARQFVNDHGGAQAMIDRLNSGAENCCDRHTADTYKEANITVVAPPGDITPND